MYRRQTPRIRKIEGSTDFFKNLVFPIEISHCFFVIPVDSPVDSTFEWSENVAIADLINSSNCC